MDQPVNLPPSLEGGPERSGQGKAALAGFIGNLIRSERTALGLSQEQLARRTVPRVTRGAISQIENGLNCPKVMVLEALTRALHLDPAEVLEELRRFIDRKALPYRDPETLRAEAKVLFSKGEYLEAVTAYQQAVSVLTDRGDGTELLWRTQVNLSVALRRAGALRAARSIAEQAIEAAQGHDEVQACGFIAQAAALEKMKQTRLALVAADQALMLARDTAIPILISQALNQRASAMSAAGHLKRAYQSFREALSAAREAGDVSHEVKILGNLGLVLARRGRPKHAVGLLERSVALAASRRTYGAQAWQLASLAYVLLQSGRLREADDRAREAIELRPAEPVTLFRAEWTRYRIDQLENTVPRNARRLDWLTRQYRRVSPVQAAPEIEEFREHTGVGTSVRGEKQCAC